MGDMKADVFALLRQVSAELILPRFQNLHADQISTKSSATDFVTIADTEAEQWISPRLQAIFDCEVIGEEASAANGNAGDRVLSGHAWTIDPIDGTSNFVKGRERFCTMIALTLDGVPQQAWIYHQLADTLYYAAAGEGAFCITATGENRIYAGPTAENRDEWVGAGNVLGVTEPAKSAIQSRMKQLAGRRFPGSAGIQGTLIASGREDYMMHGNCTAWDHAPVDLLCREAGGHSAMIETGAPYRAGQSGPYMASANKAIWDHLHATVWNGE